MLAVFATADVAHLRRDMEWYIAALSSKQFVEGTYETAIRTLAAAEATLDAEKESAANTEWFVLDEARARLRGLCLQQEDNITYAHHLAGEFDIVAPLAAYTNPEVTSQLRSQLPSSPFFAFYDTFLVKENQYEELFKKMVEEVVALYGMHFTEVVGRQLPVRVVRDIASTAEAWYTTPGEIIVNIARPVTQEKLQQLVAHEVMHHVQALACRRTRASALFLEGGAEYAVDLVFPPGSPRAAHLERFFGTSPADASTLVSVSAIRSSLSWRHVVRIASAMFEGTMDDATGNAEMESLALLRQDSWPSVDFMRQWGFGYVATYAIGKLVIGEFVDAVRTCIPHATKWDVFVAFTRCTPTPRTAQRYAADCRWVNAWFYSC